MRIALCPAVLAVILSAQLAHADISFDQHVKIEAAGAMSMLASEGDNSTLISGDKSLTESSINMQSKLAAMFAGGGKTGSIVRLDKALMWNLFPEKQQYAEMTFAQVKAQMDQARKSMQDAQASGGPGGGLPVSAEGCQWSEGEVQVEHPAGTEQIAGLASQKHTIRMQQSCTDPKTAKTCDITLLMETWLGRDIPGEQEATKFAKAYAAALGLGDVMQQAQGPGQSLLAMFSTNWEDVVGEFQKLEGYPLRTVMQMDIGGAQCTTASGQPIAQDGNWSTGAGSALGQSAGEALGGSLGGAVGSAAGQLIGGLSGMFNKSEPTTAAEKPAAQESQATAANGQVTVFRISTAVTKWSQAPIPQERFDIPVGWKKI